MSSSGPPLFNRVGHVQPVVDGLIGDVCCFYETWVAPVMALSGASAVRTEPKPFPLTSGRQSIKSLHPWFLQSDAVFDNVHPRTQSVMNCLDPQ